jgi:hypothetical protein
MKNETSPDLSVDDMMSLDLNRSRLMEIPGMPHPLMFPPTLEVTQNLAFGAMDVLAILVTALVRDGALDPKLFREILAGNIRFWTDRDNVARSAGAIVAVDALRALAGDPRPPSPEADPVKN